LTEQQRVLVRKELFHQNRKYMGEAVDPGVQGGPRGRKGGVEPPGLPPLSVGLAAAPGQMHASGNDRYKRR
jgi:hypothetical protein